MSALIQYFIVGTFGVVLQICFKIIRLKQASKNANHAFSFKEYITDDWPAVLASFATLGILCFCLDEALAIRPELAKIVKYLFAFVGFTGSNIAQSLFSLTSKKISAIIDIKTDAYDGKKSTEEAKEELGNIVTKN